MLHAHQLFFYIMHRSAARPEFPFPF
jgi:hypothetical protein